MPFPRSRRVRSQPPCAAPCAGLPAALLNAALLIVADHAGIVTARGGLPGLLVELAGPGHPPMLGGNRAFRQLFHIAAGRLRMAA
ncbi:hypothetical protein GIY62_24090 [Burkholderia plantarii]|uniref:hypothetical protein n=1 Tax=Burkholderia plantarii TaxID=41899 RepID=UPI00272AC484|nr:hypothetical protein [Burkholderia plantarii]WLE63383.1 hypothetical protein GIY62_24090 [Burkholderia plantarii]